MVFSKFFKSRDASDDEPRDEAGEEEQFDDEGTGPAPEEMQEDGWAERAATYLATGASTASKTTSGLYGVGAFHGPTHFQHAEGCRITIADGGELVDCTMALGTVAIGYAHPEITRAVMATAGAGHVSGLSHVLEVEVAERFCEAVPCSEKVQFLKTGSEAVAAAVRIARVYTGRDVVVGCGRFGWHDWCSDGEGVPAAVKGDFRSIPFDDYPALERAASVAGSNLAAIVIEPVADRLPSEKWIERARSLCDQLGAVLIFDELNTGFRIATGGYQEVSGITPDLAAFGKALANGYPLSAVCGRADVMDAASRTWISSTLASEGTALAAAFGVLELHRAGGVCEELAAVGAEMRGTVERALRASGVTGVSIDGLDQMWSLSFDSPDRESHFVRAAVANGVLFQRGPYNFASLAHDDEAILSIERAASNGFVSLRDSD